MRPVLALLALLLLVTGCSSDTSAAERPLLVAAAADLQPAFEKLGRAYEKQTGEPVTFSFGSSGQLAEQLKNGAPYDVFASASDRYVDEVLRAGRGEPDTRAEYALGRLAVWTPEDEVTLEQLSDPRFERIVLANPEHAPYGLAAQQALQSSGVHRRVQPRLVYGENVADALRLATSGNADAAVVALSLVQDRADGVYSVVPAQAHAPLRQALVVTAEPARAADARRFADLVTSEDGQDVLARYGFSPPAG